jgi:hypothetical protein
VQLGGRDVEVGDHAQDRRGDQACPVGVEQLVEGAADPIVVEHFGVAGRDSEHAGVVGARPLTECVDRTVTHHEVAHHHLDHRCRVSRNRASPAGRYVRRWSATPMRVRKKLTIGRHPRFWVCNVNCPGVVIVAIVVLLDVEPDNGQYRC